MFQIHIVVLYFMGKWKNNFKSNLAILEYVIFYVCQIKLFITIVIFSHMARNQGTFTHPR